MKATFDIKKIDLEKFTEFLKVIQSQELQKGEIYYKEYKYFKFKIIYTLKYNSRGYTVTSKKVER